MGLTTQEFGVESRNRAMRPGEEPERKEKRDEDYRNRTWPCCSYRHWEHAASDSGELAASHPGVLHVNLLCRARCMGAVFMGC